MFLGLTESKLNADRDCSKIYDIQGYTFLRFDRKGSEGGGTVVYVNNNFVFEQIEYTFDVPRLIECNIFKLACIGIKAIHVAVVYIPPQSVNNDALEFLLRLFELLRSMREEFVVIGDLNIDLLSRSTHSSSLFDMCKQFNVHQKINFPTRISCYHESNGDYRITSSLLDHVYVSNNNLYSSGGFDYAASDHKLVFVVRKKVKLNRIGPKIIEFRSFKSVDIEKLKATIGATNWSCIKTTDVNESLLRFENLVLTYLDTHAPLKRKIIKLKF